MAILVNKKTIADQQAYHRKYSHFLEESLRMFFTEFWYSTDDNIDDLQLNRSRSIHISSEKFFDRGLDEFKARRAIFSSQPVDVQQNRANHSR